MSTGFASIPGMRESITAQETGWPELANLMQMLLPRPMVGWTINELLDLTDLELYRAFETAVLLATRPRVDRIISTGGVIDPEVTARVQAIVMAMIVPVAREPFPVMEMLSA